MDILNTVVQYQGQVTNVIKEYQLIIGVLLLPIIYFIPKIALFLSECFKRIAVLTIIKDILNGREIAAKLHSVIC